MIKRQALTARDVETLQIGQKLIIIEVDYLRGSDAANPNLNYHAGDVVTVSAIDPPGMYSQPFVGFKMIIDGREQTKYLYHYRFALYDNRDWWDIWGTR